MPTDDNAIIALRETVRLTAEVKALAALCGVLIGALRTNGFLPASAVADMLATADRMTPDRQNIDGQTLLGWISHVQGHFQDPDED